MAVEGSFDVGCRKYSYRISQPNPDETVCDAEWLPGASAAFTVDQATDAINQFCMDVTAKVTIPMQPESFLQDKFEDVTPFPQRNYLIDGTTLTIFAAFTNTLGINQIDGCAGKDKDFMVRDYADRCREILSEAVNNCK